MKIKAPRLCCVHSILLINQLKIQNLSQSNEINWSSFFDFRNKLVSEEKELRATINFNKILLIFKSGFFFKLHFFIDSCCSNFGTSNGSRGFQRRGFRTAGGGRLGRRTIWVYSEAQNKICSNAARFFWFLALSWLKSQESIDCHEIWDLRLTINFWVIWLENT